MCGVFICSINPNLLCAARDVRYPLFEVFCGGVGEFFARTGKKEGTCASAHCVGCSER